jgi:hypothetical protein
MRIKLKELLDAIKSSDLSLEAQIDLMYKIVIQKKVSNGLYVKEVEDGCIECWYINIDEDGTTYHGPTGYGIDEVISAYAQSLESQKHTL